MKIVNYLVSRLAVVRVPSSPRGGTRCRETNRSQSDLSFQLREMEREVRSNSTRFTASESHLRHGAKRDKCVTFYFYSLCRYLIFLTSGQNVIKKGSRRRD